VRLGPGDLLFLAIVKIGIQRNTRSTFFNNLDIALVPEWILEW
jgi:hypothetical protein